MAYCPRHGVKSGRFCDDCGAPLDVASPGDTVNIRSPQAEATAIVNVHVPGGPSPSAQSVPCPRCGRRNPEDQTFDCRGTCDQTHLCLRHFDKEYQVCIDCARTRRQEDRQRAEVEAALRRELAAWQQRAQEAEVQVAHLTQEMEKYRAVQAQLEEAAQADREEIERLRRELAAWQQRAQEAEQALDALREREAERLRAVRPIWQQIGIRPIYIPAGHFLAGDGKLEVYVEDFWIAETPVTNAQYKAFVDATGYEPPAHWEDGRIPPGKEDHPVVYVSWEDAAAFCQWAGVWLPTEQEWEKAARGTDGREYPWGDDPPTPELCNFNEHVGDTTPAGSYPKGASPYGVLDMAGNIWEWCADWYEPGEYKMLRGGSWQSDAQWVRCASRFRHFPASRDYDFGFRVAGRETPSRLPES